MSEIKGCVCLSVCVSENTGYTMTPEKRDWDEEWCEAIIIDKTSLRICCLRGDLNKERNWATWIFGQVDLFKRIFTQGPKVEICTEFPGKVRRPGKDVVVTHSRKETHSEGQCREWSAVYYTGGPKAESPLSQGPRPVFVKTL